MELVRAQAKAQGLLTAAEVDAVAPGVTPLGLDWLRDYARLSRAQGADEDPVARYLASLERSNGAGN